jgi:hypothetical protein
MEVVERKDEETRGATILAKLARGAPPVVLSAADLRGLIRNRFLDRVPNLLVVSCCRQELVTLGDFRRVIGRAEPGPKSLPDTRRHARNAVAELVRANFLVSDLFGEMSDSRP